MRVRFWRSNKWELIVMFASSSLLSVVVAYLGLMYMEPAVPLAEWWSAVAAAFLLVNVGFGYWAAQRFQRRIDALHLALKQVASGNMAVRIPEAGARSFTPAYREFNEMAKKLEQRMQWLQRIGEEQVMREAASNEAAVLEERKRLARDLHDTVSQHLFAIHMSASSMPKLLEINPDRAQDVLQQLIQMSSLAQKQMRGLIAQLRPLELEGRSLQEALDKWFPDYCRQNGLQGELGWRIAGQMSEAKEHQLFLIIQEAMANIVKHAGAGNVTLTASETERQYAMTLQDDGAGFRADQVKAGSYGLSTMRERAQKLGGDTEIISKPGSGTRIRVTIPKYAEGDTEQYGDERNG
jgi:two-component system, NarL family, sensor histidine kinase LiaS